jgi:hypothetical protein
MPVMVMWGEDVLECLLLLLLSTLPQVGLW